VCVWTAAMADELKAKGNEAFKAGQFTQAVDFFSQAIAVDGSNHVLYSNRSAAYASLQDFSKALDDANKAIEIKPDWPKGYSRKGAALHGLKDFDECIGAFKKGLELDPSNEQMKNGLREAEHAKDNASNGLGLFSSPELWGKIASHPQTSQYLQQPDFVQMVSELQRDPSSISKHLNDPRMQQVMAIALGVKIMTPDEMNGEAGNGSGGPESHPAAAADPEPTSTPEEPVVELTEEEKEQQDKEQAALKEKELGNAAYKKKDFEAAIAHYNKAIDLNEKDITFLTNRAAVYFEMGNYEKCVKDCDEAVEKGRAIRADFKVVAKAMARKGTALVKMGKLEEALVAYQKSLTEHRNADTLKKMNDLERTIKKKKEEAYIDPAIAEQEKEKGNERFRAQDFPEAVKHYSEAIKRNPSDHKVYSNRAACYTKLGALPEALKDAEKCIEIDPTFAKGYSRKGHAQFFMKEYNKALETYQLGLKQDPGNAELQDGVKRCVEAINRANRGELSEQELKERQEKGLQDPEVQQILQDPVMRQVLNDMQSDPKAAADHMRNPMVAANLQKLVNAGIVQMR